MTDGSANVQIVRYRRSEREDVFAFLRAAYPGKDGDRLIRQWDWKYDANPFNRDPEPYVLLLKDGAKIVGMLGSLPLRLFIAGKEHWVSHSCDWVVRPDYRDRRLARTLVKQHRTDRPLRFSWQNELSYERSRRRPDTRTIRIVPLVKSLDIVHMLEQATGNRWLSRLAGIMTLGVRRLTRAVHRQAVVPGVAIAQTDRFDERFDALAQRVREHYPVMVVRDRPYLNWRFICRPDASYTVLVATRAADLVGYLILRWVDEDAGRWGYLVDFLVEDASASVFSLLVERAVECLRREGVKAISCRVTVPAHRRTLYRYGFCPFFWGRRGYVRTNIDTPDPAVQVFGDVRQWHLTMADGDLEMAF